MAEKSRISKRTLPIFIAFLMLLSSLFFVSLTASAEETEDMLETPVLLSVTNTFDGVNISWEAVEGAEQYRVFYKTDAIEWTKICDTTSTSYTWTEAVSGTDYLFTVCCVNADGSEITSEYDPEGLAITYIAAPKLTSVSNTATGVKIEWEPVDGAENYRVFYKIGNGSWVRITLTDQTSYTWTGAKSGTKYTFTVRCTDKDGVEYVSAYDSKGLSLNYIAAPKISVLECTTTGIKISWGKVDGASKYRVFYKTGNGSWVRIDLTSDTSYTWTGAKIGTKYTFTVRCTDQSGDEYISAHDTVGRTVTYLSTPKLSTVECTATGVKLSWGKVSGATNYRLFYKTGNGSWVRIALTDKTSYTWTGAKSGTKYTFTVRCTDKDGIEYVSGFDSKGKTLTYIAAPKISAAASTTSGVKISWGKVTGASKYRVFYKTGNGSWVRIALTDSTSYTWTGAKSGTKYTFTVRCTNSSGTEYISAYDSAGKTVTHYPSLNYKATVAADKYSTCTKYVYGKSAMGYPLDAFIISGNGKNNKIIFMDFAVHGYEDEYAKDGQVLVTLGNGLVEYYSTHPELLGDYKLVIVPCANPDGAMFGKNNFRAGTKGAFGRCTYKGIDINRDFKTGGFKAVESVALKNLMNKYKPNVYLNFHGWEDSVIGDPQLVSIFRSNVGLTTDKSNKYGSDQGYIIGYVKPTYNAKAALVEFKNTKSVNQDKVIKAINKIISSKL